MESTSKDTILNKQLFGDNFKWGISVAALQIEGACNADGKGESIWDVFSSKKNRILNNDHPREACDFYNQYKLDIDIIARLNIPCFRFSISWTRILPNGTGDINQAGIDFYNRVIDYCISKGVEPWLTIYHWDLPQALENKGGWTNREIVGWFTNFATICAQSFGDRVKHWMVMNEPGVFTGAGYFLGIHAPGRTGLRNFLPAIHHAVLCMAAGGKLLRKLLPGAEIGTTFSCSYIAPHTDNPKDIAAAKRVDALLNRLFIEPVLGMGYPIDVKAIKGISKYFQPGDDEAMQFDFDFIGVQNYTREIVKNSFFTPYVGASLVKAEKRNVQLTDMKWEVYPPSIYHMLNQFSSYPKVRKIYVTENGAAFPDIVTAGEVDDPQRVAYLQNYLQQVLKAKNEGVNVQGYFIWTLMDNFEWAEGYHPRFGLVHIDFETQQRTVKSSGKWYSEFLKRD